MPASSAEIAFLGKYALDAHMRNMPVDQIGTDRPFYKKLIGKKRTFPGGKQYIVETIRESYDSNYVTYYGADSVSFQKKKIHSTPYLTNGHRLLTASHFTKTT